MADSKPFVQWVQLALDKSSKTRLINDSTAIAVESANSMIETFSKSSDAYDQYIAKQLTKYRETLEKRLMDVGDAFNKVVTTRSESVIAKEVQAQLDRYAKDIATLFKGYAKGGVEGRTAEVLQAREAFAQKQVQDLRIPNLVDPKLGFNKPQLGLLHDSDKVAAAEAKETQELKSQLSLLDKLVLKVQELKRDWTQIYTIPDRLKVGDLQSDVRTRMKLAAKGDVAEQGRLQQDYLVQQQLLGSKLTPAGQVLQKLGFDPKVASEDYHKLQKELALVNQDHEQFNKLSAKSAGGWSLLTNGVKQFAGSLGLAVTAWKAYQIASESVRAAAELDKQWSIAASSVATYGHTLSELTPQLRDQVTHARALGFTETEVAQAYATLVQVTGDVHKSMKALPTVFDLMVGRHMTLEVAAKSLGGAMMGNVESLSRQRIYIDETKDALSQLAEMFGGRALAASESLGGGLSRMSAQWTNVKIEMGRALISAGGGVGTLDAISASLAGMAQFLKENGDGLKALGLIAAAVLWPIKMIVETIVLTFQGWSKIMQLQVGYFHVSMDGMKGAFFNFMAAITLGLEQLAKVWDRIFHTNLVEKTTAAINFYKKKVEEAKAQGDLDERTTQDMLGGRYDNEDDRPLTKDVDPKTGMSVPSYHKHQQIQKEIGSLRTIGLKGDDQAANEALDKMKTKLEELKQLAKDVPADNKKEWEATNKELAMLEDSIKKVQARLSGVKEMQKEDAERRRKIEEDGQLLLSDNLETAAKAGRELSDMEKTLTKMRDNEKNRDRQREFERELLLIQEARARVAKTIGKEDDEQIKRLAKLVELDIDREKSIQTLEELRQKYQQDFAAAAVHYSQATTEAQRNQAITEREITARRIADIEKAEQVQDDFTEKRIQQLALELKQGETRKHAQQQLFDMIHRNQTQIDSAKTTPERRATLTQQNDEIRGVLGNPVDIKQLRQQATALVELTKHVDTARAAVGELVKMENTLHEAVAAGNLTDEEGAVANALIRKIQEVLKHHPLKPTIASFVDDLKTAFVTDLPEVFAGAAGKMSDVFTTAFQGMFRDVRNLTHAISSIPKGAAEALTAELKKKAQLKASENFASALEFTAKGIGDLFWNPDAAAADFGAAASYAAAGTAWAALAGVAGSLNQSASNAYGNSTAGFQGGGKGVDKSGNGGAVIYLNIDGVDPNNPNHQRLLGDTVRQYRERYGANIIVNGEKR